MTDPLLSTKLFIPQGNNGLISRPALVARLEQGLRLHRRLSLVSAPAGYGKTTLISQWIESCRSSFLADPSPAVLPVLAGGPEGQDRPGKTADRGVNSQEPVGPHNQKSPIPNLQFCWLSLDEEDNHLRRFLTYLCAAFQQIDPGLGSKTQSLLNQPHTPATQNLLTSLINELASLPPSSQIVLILDDYHLIAEIAVHEAVAFLLDHCPPNLHLVIVTRKDPLLPLARLRARAQITEIRLGALRFSSEEAAEFFRQTMGLDLNHDQVQALVERTEGWIAGLQLAAISLENQGDIEGFIRTFSGSDRHLMDYLVEEVLVRQPAEIQTFLLRTSILKRLCGDLCDEIIEYGRELVAEGSGKTEISNRSLFSVLSSQSVLEYLESSNLFVVPLDTERCWYRYHPLFVELLQRRLLYTFGPDVVWELKQRASRWFEANQQMADAIEYALSAQDYQRAAQLIEAHAIDMMTQTGQSIPPAWLEAIPLEIRQTRPMLGIISALALFIRQPDPPEVIDRCLDEIEAGWDGQTEEIKGYIYALRCATGRLRQVDPNALLVIAEMALVNLPEKASLMRWYALRGQLTACIAHANIARAEQVLQESLELTLRSGDIYNAVETFFVQAYLASKQGNLARAIEILSGAQTTVAGYERQGRFATNAGVLDVFLGKISLEQNDLARAEEWVACCGLERLKYTQELSTIMRAQVTLAWIRAIQGRWDEVPAILDQARRSWSGAEHYTAAHKVRLQLWRVQEQPGLLEDIAQYCENVHLDCVETTSMRSIVLEGEWYYVEQVSLIRGLIGLARYRGAANLEEVYAALEVQLKIAEECGWVERVIEVLALTAMAAQAKGDWTKMLSTGERAVGLAAGHGYVRLLANEGQPMGELLRQLRQQTTAPHLIPAIDNILTAILPSVAGVVPTSTGYQSDNRNANGQTGCNSQSTILNPQYLDPLSERETEVLRGISAGLSNLEIASRLFVAESTVKKHINHIYDKLGVQTRTQALVRARELGIE